MKKLALTGLMPDTDYTVQVRSTLAGQESEWSQALDFRTIVDTNPPREVTGLTLDSVGSSWVAQWNPIDLSGAVPENNDFDRYEVRFSFNTTHVVYTTRVPRCDLSLSQNISAFGQPRSPISVSVRTADVANNYSNWVTAGPISNPAPGAPVGLTSETAIESIILNWSPPADSDLDHYNVYISSTETGTFTKAASPRTNSYTYNTTSTGMIYFRVFTVDIFGTESTSYASTNQVVRSLPTSDSIAPKAPTELALSAGFDGVSQQAYVDVSWKNPNQNSDGTPLTDLNNIRIRYGYDGAQWTYTTVAAGVAGSSQSQRIYVASGTNIHVAVQAEDLTSNRSAFTASAQIMSTADSTAPSTPTAPTAVGNTMQVQVSHNNTKAAGGAMESDTAYYDVYASKLSGFTNYNATTHIGKLIKSTTTSDTFPLPVTTADGTNADKWYIKVKAVDRTGNASAASTQVEVTPGLVNTINIADASITNAKISSLKADKIEAGSAIVTEITLKDGVDPVTGNPSSGAIKSDNFNETLRTGMKLDDSGLTVYDGKITARSVELRNSFNLMSPVMASFESNLNYYIENTLRTNASLGLSLNAVVGSQSLSIVPSGPWTVNLGITPNIQVEPKKQYILSLYARGAAGAENLQAFLSYNTGVKSDEIVDVTLTTVFTRYSVVITVPTDATFVGVILAGSTSGVGQTVQVDGVQLEEKVGSLDTPSRWQPPSSTSIDGGQIRTGSLQSSQMINDRPAWAINLDGGAEFADATITGSLTVGDNSGAPSYAQSGNYGQLDSTNRPLGWKINSDGSADFNDVALRGKATLYMANIQGSLTVMQAPGAEGSVVDIGSGSIMTLHGKLQPPPAPNVNGWANPSVALAPPEDGARYYGPTFDAAGDTWMVESSYKYIVENNEAVGFSNSADVSKFSVVSNMAQWEVAHDTTWSDEGTGSLKIKRTATLGNGGSSTRLIFDTSVSAEGDLTVSVDVRAILASTIRLVIESDSSPVSNEVALNAGETGTLTVTGYTSGTWKIYLEIDQHPTQAPETNFPDNAGVINVDSLKYRSEYQSPGITLKKFDTNTGALLLTGTRKEISGAYKNLPVANWVMGFNWVGSTSFDVTTSWLNGVGYIYRFSGATPSWASTTPLTAINEYAYGKYRSAIYTDSTNIYQAYVYCTDVEENIVMNPTFQNNATGWVPGNSNTAMALDSGQRLVLTNMGAPQNDRWVIAPLKNNKVTAGEYIYATGDFVLDTPSVKGAQVIIKWADGTYVTGNLITGTSGTSTAVGVAPITGTYQVLYVYKSSTVTWSAPDRIGWIDRARVSNNGKRARNSAFTYKDGTSPGWKWEFTPFNSASLRILPAGTLVVDKVSRANPNTLLTRQYGHRVYGDLSGFVYGIGDYSTTVPTFNLTVEPDPTVPSETFGQRTFAYVATTPANNTPVPLVSRESTYRENNGISWNPSVERYFTYNRANNSINKMSKINSSIGNISVSLTYYCANTDKETIMSAVSTVDYFWVGRSRVYITGLGEPAVPESVAVNDRPTGFRLYVGAHGTKDRNKMERVMTTTGFPSSIMLDDLLTVPRGGDNTALPGNTATTALNKAPTINGFETVAGFTAAILRTTNDVFKVDGNGTGKIAGLEFNDSGLILKNNGGTSGTITTNTGGFVLNHDGTGSWPNMTEIVELKDQLRTGVNAVTAPSTGLITLDHTLGRTPQVAIAATATSAYRATVTAKTATTITVHVVNATTGANFAGNISIMWLLA